MTAIDWIILVPVLPLVPLVATWWLPWEFWVPWKKIPKALGGPYLLYVSFAAWHFKLALWLVMLLALVGLVLCIAAMNEVTNRGQDDAS